jgi:hypothetical protein
MRAYDRLWRLFHKVDYEVWITDPLGYRLSYVGNVIDAEIIRVVGGVGWVRVNLPGDFSESLLQLDGNIEIWRTAPGGIPRCMHLGSIRDWDYLTESDGDEVLSVAGPDKMDLLANRIVDYAAGSSQADKSGPIDDIMKGIVRENLGSGATADRDLTNAGFSVEANLGDGPTTSKGFSRQTVLRILGELHKESVEQGTPVYFDIVPVFRDDGRIGFEFRTYIGSRGLDRGWESGAPVVFSSERGNLENAVRSTERSQEITRVIAGGQGKGEARVIRRVNDTDRQQMSPWNLRERFVDARDVVDPNVVETRAEAELAAGRPRRRFTADLLDAPGTRFGEEWNIGDQVAAETERWQGDVTITGYKAVFDAESAETITVRAEIDEDVP